jgi:acetyl-CoA/propionyl-CoA carboxylase biotin carboxyl carrier protein
MTDIDRVLVANRGEIAVRIIGTLRRMGITAIAVYSDLDAGAVHVAAADEALSVGPADGYLQVGRVVDAAVRAGARAVHPGYGFLAENPELARACAAAGLVFVGPPVDAITAMGDKARARTLMTQAGVPVVPGTSDGDLDDDALLAAAGGIGYPLMVKPVAGGGGKGMAVVDRPDDLRAALATARRQALAAFGDGRVLLERFVDRPRHIEVQVLADDHGTVVHLGERECSLQRRHQKIIEETPSPLLDATARARIGASAVAAARACDYRGAGTVEFIVSDTAPGTFHFLEMNTRLQVEHPVTEMTTGIDLVEWQVRIAAGERLAFSQEDVRPSGHAIEARVYAEDPVRDFLPTGGTVLAYGEPSGDGVRVDSGVTTGTTVPAAYDPLLAKIIAHGADRTQALRRLDRALAGTTLLGVGTNTGFLRRLLADADVRRGALDTGLVGRRLDALAARPAPAHVLVAAALARIGATGEPAGVRSTFDLPGGWRQGAPAWTPLRLREADRVVEVGVQGTAAAGRVTVDGEGPHMAHATVDGSTLHLELDGHRRTYRFAFDADTIWIGLHGDAWKVRREPRLASQRGSHGRGGPVGAPMPGSVVAVEVREGQPVSAGQILAIVEAMKMEHQVLAPVDGIVTGIAVGPGDQVDLDQRLLVVEAAGDRPRRTPG